MKNDPEWKQFVEAVRNDLAGSVTRVWSGRSRRWQAYVFPATVIALFFLVIPIGDRVLYGASGEAHYNGLLREFQPVVPFPNAVEGRRHNSFSRWRPHQALVSASYDTTASYAELRSYYDEQLISKGWRFVEEEPVKVWGEDVGAWGAEYCKGDLAASLNYGSKVNSGYTFSFSLSWGLSQKCK